MENELRTNQKEDSQKIIEDMMNTKFKGALFNKKTKK